MADEQTPPVEETDTGGEQAEEGGVDFEKRYGDAQRKITELGQEASLLRDQNAKLIEHLGVKEQQEDQQDLRDYDEDIAEINRMVNEEGLNDTEAEVMKAEVIAEKARAEATAEAMQEMKAILAERDQAEQIRLFKETYPDYDQTIASADFQNYIASSPVASIHDPVSAYFAFKNEQSQAILDQAVKEAIEKGKQIHAQEAGGAEATKTVLGSSGAEITQTKTKTPRTEASVKAKMLAAIKEAEGGE